MKTVTIADDIYQHLLINSLEIGEDASSILRRLLKLNPGSGSVASPVGGIAQEVEELIKSHSFRFASGVVGKFLAVLSWLHRRHKNDFEKITAIRGRRIYFAKDRKTLEDSGRRVNPKLIPDSNYWVITTSPTQLKQETLDQALQLFGYDPETRKTLCEAIAS